MSVALKCTVYYLIKTNSGKYTLADSTSLSEYEDAEILLESIYKEGICGILSNYNNGYSMERCLEFYNGKEC